MNNLLSFPFKQKNKTTPNETTFFTPKVLFIREGNTSFAVQCMYSLQKSGQRQTDLQHNRTLYFCFIYRIFRNYDRNILFLITRKTIMSFLMCWIFVNVFVLMNFSADGTLYGKRTCINVPPVSSLHYVTNRMRFHADAPN